MRQGREVTAPVTPNYGSYWVWLHHHNMEHLSLIVVELLTVLIGSIKIYGKWYRHWCGARLIPQITLQLLVPMLVVAAFYTELVHALFSFVSEQFHGIFALAAAQLADVLVTKAFPHLTGGQPLVNPWSVAGRIADKKMRVVNAVLASSSPRDLLEDVIRTSALAWREQENLIVRLHEPATRQDAFLVLNEIGLAHMKTFVLGGKNGDHHKPGRPIVSAS